MVGLRPDQQPPLHSRKPGEGAQSYREESGRGYLPLALALDPVLGERMAEAIDA